MVNSTVLKCASMVYFRFERHFICATEVKYSDLGGIADVLIDTGTEILEVETKIDISDLTVLEWKKEKHAHMLDIQGLEQHFPNKFYLCVPYNLQRNAEKLIERVNPKYGLLVLQQVDEITARSLAVVKQAQPIHTQYNEKIKDLVILRLCSELANLYEKKANEFMNPGLVHYSKNSKGETGMDGPSRSKKQQNRRQSNIHLRHENIIDLSVQ